MVKEYEYLSNTDIEKAVPDYISALSEEGFSAKTETVRTSDALGRITAEAVYAKISSPHYNASAMDGIALMAKDTFGASEASPVVISSDRYVVVDTGDPLPEGTDCVVMVEDVIYEGTDARLIAAATPWQNVRQIGEDICSGDMLMPSFTEITPYSMGAMLAAGILEVNVVKKPVIGIIPTGDEVIPPSDNPSPGDVIEFNSTIFSAMLTRWGCEPKTYPIVRDRLDLMRDALEKALGECDIVMINAGSSAGRDDYTSTIIGEAGKVLYHGIAIKPGKPTILGIVQGKPVFGIPGYPVSGIIVLTEIVRPVLESILKVSLEHQPVMETTLTKRVNKSLKYREYIRVQLGRTGEKLTAVPLNRGAGVVSSFVKADGLLSIPQNYEGLEAGEKAQVTLLRDPADIDRTIIVIGSHDPLIDEISDMLRRKGSEFFISSSHVGSMGGIMAAKRGENHIGGTHLLDEESGTYNIPYLKQYFPDGDAVLIHSVYRQQGLMVTKGNPKGIKGIQDLVRPGISYVNRQKGSGTRVLLDYLLKKEGISPEGIYGYEREEFTHTSVAAQIAGGSADCGMGIYSAAKMYDLDFVFICNEQYDFLTTRKYLDTPMIQEFISVLKSPEFTDRMIAMGGYDPNRPGEIEFME
ncbi:MAG: molybdopterin biosynthesis protein [Eubacteriaceae bacterium]|nr:molybdopterin biosynthesis protein [Eubacteriaceae bacterium]